MISGDNMQDGINIFWNNKNKMYIRTKRLVVRVIVTVLTDV